MEFVMDKWSIEPGDQMRDGKIDATASIKRSLMDWMTGLTKVDSHSLSGKTVSLFHGTTTAHLNSILKHGLLPRRETNQNNWKEHSSHENIVYMTNKWHYFYAYRITDIYLTDQGKEVGSWLETWETIPCYIECKVPIEYLVPDEDCIYSRYIRDRVKSSIKKNKPLRISAEDSLNHYGTVGVLGGIPKEWIVSFSVLAEPMLYKDFYIDESTLYMKDVNKWANHGQGRGRLKLMDLWKREDESTKNATFLIKDLPKDKDIAQIGMNPNTNNLAIRFK